MHTVKDTSHESFHFFRCQPDIPGETNSSPDDLNREDNNQTTMSDVGCKNEAFALEIEPDYETVPNSL